MSKIHWQPHPRQEVALLRAQDDIDELLYGGARGGGKTDAGQVWLIEPKYIKHPKYRALVVRKNADDLSDWLDRAEQMYAPLGGVRTGLPAVFTFPSGAKIKTGHLKDKGAYTKYQGHEYQKMLIEELTQIALEGNYEKLLGSCRSTIAELKAQTFATTNPDGDGHEWVKKRFDCNNPDEKVREFHDEQTGVTKRRLFIPAKVEDNPTLVDNDPGYVAYLNNISDETLRKQWRDGSWEEPIIEGAYYKTQFDKIKNENRITKVPYESGIEVDTWWDLGMSDHMTIWFTQIIGTEKRVIDYLEAEGEGLEYYARVLKEKGYVYGTHYFPHDGAVREIGTGVSRQETAEKLGIRPVEIVPKLAVYDGIEASRNILDTCYFDGDKCRIGIGRLKRYKKIFDEKRNCYKDSPEHNVDSHGADAFRTFAVGYGKFKSMLGDTDEEYRIYDNNLE